MWKKDEEHNDQVKEGEREIITIGRKGGKKIEVTTKNDKESRK